MHRVKCKIYLTHSAKHCEYKSVPGFVEGFTFLEISRSPNNVWGDCALDTREDSSRVLQGLLFPFP